MSNVDNRITIPVTHLDILEDRPTGHLATLRSDGMLSANPISIMWDGKDIRFSTVKSRKKYKNMLADSRIALSIPHRNNPNHYIEVRGRVELSDDPNREFINNLAKVFLQLDEYPFDKPGDERVTARVIVEQISAPQIPLADNPPTAPDR